MVQVNCPYCGEPADAGLGARCRACNADLSWKVALSQQPAPAAEPAVAESTSAQAHRDAGLLDSDKQYPCPVCQQPTGSLKCYYFADWMLCLLIWVIVWERLHLACPACMRRLMRRQLALNALTAHLAWPAVLIIYLPRYLATYRAGHSRPLTQPLRKPPGVIARVAAFFDTAGRHPLAYIALIVSAVCSGSLAFARGAHETFETSRIWLAATLLLLMLRLYVDIVKSQRPEGDQDRGRSSSS